MENIKMHKKTGRVPIFLRLRKSSTRSLRAQAKKERKSISEIADKRPAVV